MASRLSRRRFLKIAVAGTMIAVGAISGLVYFSPKGTSTTSRPTTTFQTSKAEYPIGNRVVRIRPLNDDQSWANAMGAYTTDTVLGWINDLKPTTLNRYISGPQVATQVLPGSQNLTVAEFLQASVNACSNPNGTTMFPRLSFDYYLNSSSSTFMQYAQQLFTLCSSLSPPQTILSIDNYNAKDALPDATALALADSLFAMGWTGLCWGAGGQPGPKGYATFAMSIPKGSSYTPDWAAMAALQALGGYGEFEVQIDFPSDMQTMITNNTPDQIAAIFTQLAQAQSQASANGINVPVHYMYPIIQGRSANTTNTFLWDSTKIFTSASGSYGGQSLYEVMKNLMNQYNP